MTTQLKVEMRRLSELVPFKRNARTHSEKQVRQIARSMKRFGITNPFLIDDDNRILAGHGRLAAAKSLGYKELPCIRLSGMSEADKRAYVIADNKLGLNSGWDNDLLAGELRELMELGIDPELTGFDMPDIDQLLIDADEGSTEKKAPEDLCPEPAPEPVTLVGDLWLLGRHRLLCGDAKSRKSYETLLSGEYADMIFTDPPYNLVLQGNVTGRGKIKHREFQQASGEMSPASYAKFLGSSFEQMQAVSRNGAIAFTFIDWRHLAVMLNVGYELFTELKNICVWNKSNAGMGTFYRSQHELVLVWKIGDQVHTNNFGLGDRGRSRSNIWSYAGVNSFKAERSAELAMHPTVKPVALVADAIRDVTDRGQTVLDPFGGSGTTLIAAEKVGRLARLIEIDPIYCDVTIRRWEKLTGKQATLAATGETFEAAALARSTVTAEASDDR